MTVLTEVFLYGFTRSIQANSGTPLSFHNLSKYLFIILSFEATVSVV
jgi:hypothetical protein